MPAEIHAIDQPPSPGAELGALIREARLRRGLRQTDLAAALGVGLSAVATWERGIHDMPAARLPAVARVLGVRFEASEDGWRMVEPGQQSAAPVTITQEAVDLLLTRLGLPPTE